MESVLSIATLFDLSTLGSFVSIILISLSLSGDNALVIGMAVHGLSHDQRRWALVGAITGAIAFRVFFAGLFAVLLYRSVLPGIRLVGGLLLVWIAWKLILEPPHLDEDTGQNATGLWEAITIILIADASMSVDNMLAVASASNGDIGLIVAGLLISIPLLFVGATAVSRVLDRFPRVVWLGGGVIGWVAGELIAEEPLLDGVITFDHASLVISGVVVLVVVGSASVWKRVTRPPSVM